MTRRAKIWLVVADAFTVINLAGAGVAAARGESLHATVHIGLAILAPYLVWRIGMRSRRVDQQGVDLTAERVEQLQQSVDAIALEVERIGEAQRFNAKLQSERVERER